MITEQDLANLPWGFKFLIWNTIKNSKCTQSHVLILAEAVDGCIIQLPPVSFYLDACKHIAARLREVAAEISETQP